MSTTKSNLDIVRDHYDASTRGDTTAMMADVAPDVRWTEMAGFPCAGTWVGPRAVLDNVFGVLGRDWKDYRFELDTLLDAGEHVIGVGLYQGQYRATNKSIRARVTHIWTLKDGKVVAFEQFTDTLLVHQAMV